MRPIHEHDWAKINVVVGAARPVDHHRTNDTFPGLDGVVRVVPREAVLDSNPSVNHGATVTRDGTLGDGWHAVHFVGVPLADTVEVNAGTVGCEVVHNSHLDSVTPVSLDQITGDLAVDDHGLPYNTIGGEERMANVKMALDDGTGKGPFVVVVGLKGETAVVVEVSRLTLARNASRDHLGFADGREGRGASGLGRATCRCSPGARSVDGACRGRHCRGNSTWRDPGGAAGWVWSSIGRSP